MGRVAGLDRRQVRLEKWWRVQRSLMIHMGQREVQGQKDRKPQGVSVHRFQVRHQFILAHDSGFSSAPLRYTLGSQSRNCLSGLSDFPEYL